MHQRTNIESIRILVAEDSESDRVLFSDSLDHLGIEAKLQFFGDGVETLSFLKRECKFGSFGKPDLLMLDLCLPRMDGKEILAELKQDPLLRDIPVVVFSNSNLAADIAECTRLGAAYYMVKPTSFEAYSAIVLEILQKFSPKFFAAVPNISVVSDIDLFV